MNNLVINILINLGMLWITAGVVASSILTVLLAVEHHKFTWKIIKEVLIFKIVWGPYYLYRVIEGWFMENEKEK